MKYFCTLSDWNYLAKGLALYDSLRKTTAEPFTLFYLCMDDQTYEKLQELQVPGITPVSLKAMEELREDLREARANRPYNEYCWTLASYFCWDLLKGKLDHVTYIDSDIYFYDDIGKFYAEVGTKSVGIIAHRHNSVGDKDGAYNVGIIYFKNDKVGQECLFWWMDAVLNKRFPHLATCGDQKYLEDFIPRFGADNVAVVDKTIGHGAPWNYRLYGWDTFDKAKTISWGGKQQPFIFNHFSRFSYDLSNDTINFTTGKYGDHTLGGAVFNIPQVFNLYKAYYLELKKIHEGWIRPKVMKQLPDSVLPTYEKDPIQAPAIIREPPRISFGMIVLNGDYVLKQCLEAVYPFADQILVAEGPVSYWASRGITTSTDRTNEILASFPDPRGKLRIIHGKYTEKDDQCQAYMGMRNPDLDYLWNLDSDEIYKAEDIEKVIKLLRDEQYTSMGVKSCSFFGGFDRYLTGFEQKADNFLRIFKVYPGSTWKTHRPPTMVHLASAKILPPKHLNSDALFDQTGVLMYHYSYVFPRQVQAKISYYKEALTKEKCIDDYFSRVYLPWVTGNSQQRAAIEKEFQGVHEWKPEYRGPCMTEAFTGTHPEPIARDMAQLKEEFDIQLRREESYARKI